MKESQNLLLHCELVEVQSNRSDDVVDYRPVHLWDDDVGHSLQMDERGRMEGAGGWRALDAGSTISLLSVIVFSALFPYSQVWLSGPMGKSCLKTPVERFEQKKWL